MDAWYVTEVQPLLRLQLIREEHTTTNHNTVHNSSIASTSTNQDLLLTITDCVTNAAIAKLERLALELCETLPDDSSLGTFDINQSTTKRRAAMALQGLYRVQVTNSMAAKPLEFGLKQLGCAQVLSDNY